MLRAIRRRDSEGRTLRGWMERWMNGGRDLRRSPDLISELNDELRYYRLQVFPVGLEELNEPELPRLWLPNDVQSDDRLLLSSGGKAIAIHFSIRGNRPLLARRFVDFVLGPDADRLRQCGRPSCTEYFVRAGKHTTYCSDGCGRSTSASAAMRARREKDQKRRLQLARQRGEDVSRPMAVRLEATTRSGREHHLTLGDEARPFGSTCLDPQAVSTGTQLGQRRSSPLTQRRGLRLLVVSAIRRLTARRRL